MALLRAPSQAETARCAQIAGSCTGLALAASAVSDGSGPIAHRVTKAYHQFTTDKGAAPLQPTSARSFSSVRILVAFCNMPDGSSTPTAQHRAVHP